MYIVFLDVLGVKPTEYVRMMKAYENLGKTPLGVLLNRRTLAWATRLLAMEDPPPPKKNCMFSMMAKRRGPRADHMHFDWTL